MKIKIKGIEREKTIILLTAFIHLFTKFSTGFPHKMWKTINKKVIVSYFFRLLMIVSVALFMLSSLSSMLFILLIA